MTNEILRTGIYEGDPDIEPPMGTSDHALWLVHWHLVLERADMIPELGKLYQDDIVWELHLPGAELKFEGKEAVLAQYTALSQAIGEWSDVNNDFFATPTRVFIDQSVSIGYKTAPASGELTGESLIVPGGEVKGRLLHNFHIRDGLIAREIAYSVPSDPPTP